ncbi:MAG: Superoxide dismutase [uncultured Campylobacterales bacterium]|uniref:Superoxide dismutase n=1 Tax=uncultured Campylobacterales bacterium TaxID=352960 RepID=A0A6S6S1V4_9BACT|nr:MAG: Superoxide dismutase [uncultured Campylobacterales bacterium]
MKRISMILILLASFLYSHCQIPCGIYDDNAKVKEMLQDVATIKKALNSISELSKKKDAQSYNQLIRWVNNKEAHSQNIIATISDYFLTQRVKESQKDYVQRLKEHHKVIIDAMKTKQNSDMKYANELEKSILKLVK